MRYISRSSYDTFLECERKGFWRYLSGPFADDATLGLEEPRDSYHLTIGIAWHAGAEKLITGGTGLEAFAAAREVVQEEALDQVWWNWLLAAFLAWERTKREEFFERWEVVSVEEEFEIPISPSVVLYTRADAIVRDRGDGSYWVLNWKTASDVKDWNRKWFFDPQGWTEAIAAEAKLGVEVRGTVYLGVWKGPFWNGRTTSRLIYGYKNFGKSGVTYGTETGGGSVKFSAWEEKFPFGDGLAAWISWLPKDFLAKHFVESAPQLRQDIVVEKWLRQVVQRENDIDHALSMDEEDKLLIFPQKWGEDTCGKCAYKPLCLGQTTPETLITDGFLKPRHRSPRDEAEARRGEG